MDFLVLIVFGFLLVWVFILLPQRRRMSAHSRMIEGVKVGDEVLTVGGLYGDVTEVGDDELALEVAPGVEVRVSARAIASVTPPGTYVDEEHQEADEAGGAEPEAVAGNDAGGNTRATTEGAADEPPEEPRPAEPPGSATEGRR